MGYLRIQYLYNMTYLRCPAFVDVVNGRDAAAVTVRVVHMLHIVRVFPWVARYHGLQNKVTAPY